MVLMLATLNLHKANEIRTMLEGSGVSVVTLCDRPDLPEPSEDGATFYDNALLKARLICELTGLPTLADDSGLEVDALGGSPGVHSKRFSPEATTEANNRLLIVRMDGVVGRRARFRCALALAVGGWEGVVEGRCEGTIGREPRGERGFGYDPLFLPDEAPGRTMAELSAEEKNLISHRGRAMAKLPELLRAAGLVGQDHA